MGLLPVALLLFCLRCTTTSAFDCKAGQYIVPGEGEVLELR
jgi:hypothetical protein